MVRDSGDDDGVRPGRRPYEPPAVTEFGSIPARTLASEMGASSDGVKVIMQDVGMGM